MKTDKIAKVEGGFQVLSMKGEPLGDPFKTEEEARERLRQIEAAKASKDGDGEKEEDEEDEPEGRGDSKSTMARRVDYLGEIHFDAKRSDGILAKVDEATGFLRLDARLTRIGVFQYGDAEGNTWGELRTEDEVFRPEAMRSFEMVVLTDDHPEDFVSAENVRDVQVGHVGSDVRRDGDFLVASILVTNAETIAKIRDGKQELSCGYTAAVVQDSGVAEDGTPYAGRQTRIGGNHVAIVDHGRAGSDCRLLTKRGDAFSITQETKDNPMKEEKTGESATIQIGDQDYQVPQAVADRFAELSEPAPQETKDTTSELRARVDFLEAQAKEAAASEAARIDARVSLVTTARSVLGAEVPTLGISDSDLMRQTVLAVSPNMEAKLDANQDAPGYLRAAFENATEKFHQDQSRVDELTHTIFQAKQDGAQKIDLAQIHQDYHNKIRGLKPSGEA